MPEKFTESQAKEVYEAALEFSVVLDAVEKLFNMPGSGLLMECKNWEELAPAMPSPYDKWLSDLNQKTDKQMKALENLTNVLGSTGA